MIPSLQVKLFGVPSITINGELLAGFISSKALATVCYLVDTGRPQSREVLATLLWTNSPEVYARKSLRNVLSNLRTLLAPFLEIPRTTVTFLVEKAEMVDTRLFLSKVQAAQKAPPNSLLQQQLLTEAVELYHGPFLQGLTVADAEGFEDWLRNERQHYQQLTVQALHDLVACTAHQGQLLQAIGYASRLLALDPLHEDTHRQLMLLLALDGQSSAALAQYRACQQILRQELGVEPNVETRQLYARIQAGEISEKSVQPYPSSANAATAVSTARNGGQILTTSETAPSTLLRHNLPVEVTTFIGRDQEVAQIRQRLDDPTCRLLTLVGMGGVGKTRLALHLAHALVDASAEPISSTQATFGSGVFFIPLSSVEVTPQLESVLVTTVADALKLTLSGSTALLAQLTQALYDKKTLLIFDNFEHLAAAASFVNTLLQGTRHLKMLVTSRVRLNIRGEAVIQLAGLALPALSPRQPVKANAATLQTYGAIQLFVQRAQAASDFQMEDTALSCVVRACQLLQGLPLGIELAATWTRLLTCAEIVAEMENNLDFLEATLTDLPLQQRSLRAVFDHSWRLLLPQEQQSLQRLAVFRGGFTRNAAATVTDTTLPLLAALVDKSLLRRSDPLVSPVEPGSSPAVRYEMVELVRQYAAEQLAQAGERAALAARHAAWVAEFLAGQRAALESAHQQAALQVIHAEIENIRAAWQWLLAHLQDNQENLAAIETQIAQSFAALFHFYDMRSWFQEGEEVFRQLASRLPARPTMEVSAAPAVSALWRLQANAQARQGWFAFHLGHYRQSRALLEESLRQLRALGVEQDTIFSLNYLGAVLRHEGDYAAAQVYLQEALALAQNHDDPLHASIALNTLGQVASLQGQWDAARALLHRALAIKRQIGDRWGLTYSLTYLGRVAQATGDHPTAHQLFQESLVIYQEIGDQRGAAFALRNLGDSTLAVGQVAQAAAHYQESLRIYQEIGNRAEASLTLTRLGEGAYGVGDFAAAGEHLHTALALAWAVQSTLGQLAAVLGLAGLALATGQPDQAGQPLQIVYHHAASNQVQKQQAAQWLTDNGFSLATPAGLDLAAYVQTHLGVVEYSYSEEAV